MRLYQRTGLALHQYSVCVCVPSRDTLSIPHYVLRQAWRLWVRLKKPGCDKMLPAALSPDLCPFSEGSAVVLQHPLARLLCPPQRWHSLGGYMSNYSPSPDLFSFFSFFYRGNPPTLGFLTSLIWPSRQTISYSLCLCMLSLMPLYWVENQAGNLCLMLPDSC